MFILKIIPALKKPLTYPITLLRVYPVQATELEKEKKKKGKISSTF